MSDATSTPRSKMPGWLRKTLNLDYILTATIFVVLVVITFSGVISRYFLGEPFAWLEELQLALFVALIYLGGAAAFRLGAHVAIDMLVDTFSVSGQRITRWVTAAFVTLILGFFAWQGIGLVANLAAVERTTNILQMPASVIYAVVPVGMVWMIINYLVTEIFGLEEDEQEVLAHV